VNRISGAPEPQAPGEGPLTDALSKRLSVSRVGETRAMRVGFWSHDPDLPHLVVNTLIREYLADQVAKRTVAGQELDRLLVQPLQELQTAVRRSEEALERYRREAGIVDVLDAPLVARQISTITEQLLAVRATRLEAESRAQQSSAAEGLRRELGVQRFRESALEQELERLRTEYERQNQAGIRARELERETSVNRALLQSFQERHRQLQIQTLAERPNAVVQSWAEPPYQPAGPRRTMLLAISAMFAVGFSVLVALMLEGWKRGVRSPSRR
jgi:uncharacterized protein involved in exopolysaccharide biosynthesis